MAHTLREPLIVAEPVAAGAPELRSPLVVGEALANGVPALRSPLIVGEPLAGGFPTLRAALIVVESLIPVPEELPVATAIFPTLIGLTFDVKKTPETNTAVREVTSGRETATSFMQYARWNFELTYDYLPDSQVWSSDPDARTLAGFFVDRNGRFEAWLFRDPDDYHVVGGTIATGDGVTLQWPFFAPIFGSTAQPVGQVDFSQLAAFLPANVNTGTNQITITAHGLTNGQGPVFAASSATLPSGLAGDAPYWVIVVDSNTIQLASSLPNALAATAVSLGSTGTGSLTLTKGFAVYETVAETHSVPGTGPYTVTVSHAAAFLSDGGVTIAGAALLKVPSSPATGQYSEAAGVYTFNSAQASASAVITYTYQATPSNVSITRPNQLVFGVAPAAGTIITADFDYWFVCRFLEDKAEFNKFMFKLWEMQKLTFRSVIQ